MSDDNRVIEVPKFMQDVYNDRRKDELLSEMQRKEMYIANKKRVEKQEKLKIEKKKLFKKRVKSAVIASALVVTGAVAFFASEQFIGSEKIANEFFKNYGKEYCVDNQSYGFVIFKDGKQISLDSGFYDMVNDARYGRMTEPEIYIAISKLYSSELAKKYVGDISLEERIAAKQEAFALGLAEKIGIEWNVDKTSGGRLR